MKQLLLWLRSHFPTKFPVGMTEFESWSDDIIKLVGPIADEISLKFALASQLIHYPSGKHAAPMQYFVRCLRKSAANQVASQVFQNIKTEQTEVQKALKTAADTPTSQVIPVASSSQT